MLQGIVVGRAVRLAFALALTLGSLVALIRVSSGVVCGLPDFAPLYTLLLLFSFGVVWLGSELVLPRLLAMPLVIGIYFAVGSIGLALARTFSDWGDVREESAWIPFWLIGLFLATGVLPGSC